MIHNTRHHIADNMILSNSGPGSESYKKIDHVAIAVLDLEKAIQFYTGIFSFEVVERRTTKGKKSGMISAVLAGNDYTLVLVQGDSPASQVSRYIEKYGPGVQHMAFEVEDIESIAKKLKEKGFEFITDVITAPGLKQIFSCRDANSGMMIELIERNQNYGFDDSNVNQLFEALENSDYY